MTLHKEIGLCSICGGSVTIPETSGNGDGPTVASCQGCNAISAGKKPTIAMVPLRLDTAQRMEMEMKRWRAEQASTVDTTT